MTISKSQKMLLQAIRDKNITDVRELLELAHVDPNFPGDAVNTPLHEAVQQNSLTIIKLLVENGANVQCYTRGWVTPRRFAEQENASKSIINFLLKEEDKSRQLPYISAFNNRAKKKKKTKPKGKPKTPPRFTAGSVPEIFKPEKWIGQIEKMQKEWRCVPRLLRKKFDIAAATVEARRQTLKLKAPANKIVLKREAPAVPPNSPPALPPPQG